MALPRTLSVKKINGNWILLPLPDVNLDNNKKMLPLKSNQFELQFSITPSNKETISGVRIAVGKDSYFEIGHNNEKQTLYIDRSKIDNDSFNVNYKKMNYYEKKVTLKNNKIDLQIYFDNSIAEIFVNGGEAVFTAQVFPKKDDVGIELFSKKSKTIFSNIIFYEMKSAWK
jgi:sucrose-6-phosphate hydrolase SacC (GH32 family)